ncbi:MAG TPA: proline dehydrogenase family protein, partial [Gaiellaceae bacterium]|nr:proline dehydrogenase family protein [Gaiellaceae bacterium]
DACRVVKRLNEQGKLGTIDVLGEEAERRDEAETLVEEYMHVFETIREQGLNTGVSVKLTGLGLKPDRDFCVANLARIVRCASERNNFVRIDMEDSSTTSDTLAIYRELRAEGHENVGIVLQARLRRTLDDIRELAELRPSVRVCKGIYVEPPDIAYQEDQEVRENFVQAVDELLAADSYVAVATHDEWVIEEAQRLFQKYRRARSEYEFQMLLGVREHLGDALVREGHRVRIYVPFGRRWYEYSIRRLQENPAIAGYVAVDTLNRLVPRRDGRNPRA